MGDMADYYRNSHEELLFEEHLIEIKDYMWRTKDGKQIRLFDMTDEHLANAINMVNRNASSLWTFYILSHEMKRRGLKPPVMNELFVK